jgi:hypothetical protein
MEARVNRERRAVAFGLAVCVLSAAFGMVAAAEDGSCSSPPLSNGGFEDPQAAGATRLPSWYLGFADEPLPPAAGNWALDSEVAVEGTRSLRLEPREGIGVSQVLHLPGALLEGRTISAEVWVRHEGTSEAPLVLVAALNPRLPTIDPLFGPGFAGAFLLVADPQQDGWQRLSGTLTAAGPASFAFVYLSAPGSGGRVWFDGVRVAADPWSPGPGPDPQPIHAPLTARGFDLGLTAEGPMDVSEQGRACLVETAAGAADVLNVFFAVRWCRLGADTCASDPLHAFDLERVAIARQHGLKVALTFDFTHGDPEDAGTIGDLNPRPDGSSPGSLLDEPVRRALADELLWLVEMARPEIVMVGIEVDIFAERHPEQWGAFVTMEREVHDRVKAGSPATHVTCYHRVSWSVDDQGHLRPEAAAMWQQLLGGVDSIAYSIYPNTALPDLPVASYPPGYFSRPADIAPHLPVLVPELGMAGGDGSGYTDSEQAAVLSTMLAELATVDPVAVIWFQLFDRLYLEAPQWVSDAFDHIGLFDLAGTPKESFVVWQKTFSLPRLRPSRRAYGRLGQP